ncbi:interleukin-20 receptor subunit beta [Stigmatopora nigra]
MVFQRLLVSKLRPMGKIGGAEITHAPLPGHITMDSVNLKHILRWRPPRVQCDTPLLYSVQYQGEFELIVWDGKWLNSQGCQKIERTHCDLSLELGSDSDYNIRVQIHCGNKTVAWQQLKPSFNRRDTILTVPQMKVSAVGGTLLVSLERPPHTALVQVEVLKSGEAQEKQAQVFTVPAKENLLRVANLQERAEYCVRAHLQLLGKQMQSQRTSAECVRIPGPKEVWKTSATIALLTLFTFCVVFGVVWYTIQCHQHKYWHCFTIKLAPHVLSQFNWSASNVAVELPEEVCVEALVVPKDHVRPSLPGHGHG